MDKTTKNNRKYWLLGGFVVGFFVVGVPYWQIPYAKVSLPDSLYGTGLLVVGVLAAAACGLGKARLFSVILVLGGSVPAAVLARVAVDTAKDPTSHNLLAVRVHHCRGRRSALFVGWSAGWKLACMAIYPQRRRLTE